MWSPRIRRWVVWGIGVLCAYKQILGGGAVLCGGRTSRADLVGEQLSVRGWMHCRVVVRPACKVSSMCASLPEGTQRVMSSA